VPPSRSTRPTGAPGAAERDVGPSASCPEAVLVTGQLSRTARAVAGSFFSGCAAMAATAGGSVGDDMARQLTLEVKHSAASHLDRRLSSAVVTPPHSGARRAAVAAAR
jgi:hypothetical protein